MPRFQFVWWGYRRIEWPLFRRSTGSWKYIYDWSLDFGCVEVRKWHMLTDGEREELNRKAAEGV